MTIVLGIHGSPRAGGNSARLLERALEGANEAGAEIRKVSITDANLSPCTACSHCSNTGECDVMDGMQDIYKQIDEADIIIVSTPVYFSGLPSQLKAIIDRCQCLWVRKEVLGQVPRRRLGALISVGGAESPIFRNVISVVRSFFMVIGVACCDTILVSGADAIGDIEGRPELDAAHAMGRALVEGSRMDG
jgi:multimeric flavodoxin WrbA